jgi:hypothetical protein
MVCSTNLRRVVSSRKNASVQLIKRVHDPIRARLSEHQPLRRAWQPLTALLQPALTNANT